MAALGPGGGGQRPRCRSSAGACSGCLFDKAVADGDFAMLDSELQPVLRKLRGAGISVVAIHQHMTGEEPRIMFLHYWGVGGAETLAKGIRAALDVTKTK